MIKRTFYLTLICLLLSCTCFCKVIPTENGRLNYTSVYFEENFVKDAFAYRLDVFSDSLLTQLVSTKTNTLPAFWISDLNWDSKYFWKVTTLQKDNRELATGKVHRFYIIKISYQGFDKIKVEVRTNKEDQTAGGLLSVDYTKSIIDRKGRVVWTIPPLPGITPEMMYIRDMRITKDNTITFLTYAVPHEIDLNGNVVWKAPHPFVLNTDTVNYHHAFKKTDRGTYMVLADKFVYRPLLDSYSPEELKNSPDVRSIGGKLCKKVLMTTLLEFNKAGKLIWYWDANDYVEDVDLNFKKVELGTPNFATHANAFSESRDGTKIYVGFRDLCRIVRLDKATKKVEWSYGEVYPSGEARTQVAMKNQHDANPSDHNSIYVFNNNGFTDLKTISGVLEISENTQEKDPVLWRFDMNFDTLTNGKSINGGNITALWNKDLLICAGALNRIIEITKDKEIVWDALFYLRGNHDTTWQPFAQYKASWTTQLNWYHFLAETKAAAVKSRGKHETELTIYNTGNTGDDYEIEVVSADNKTLQTFSTDYLNAGKSFKKSIKVKQGGVKLHVKSRNSQQTILLSDLGVN